jgi:hypothetical protein
MTELDRQAAKHALRVIDITLNPPRSRLGAVARLVRLIYEVSTLPELDPYHSGTTRTLNALFGFLIDSRHELWSSPQAKRAGLRRLALASYGTGGTLNEPAFVHQVVDRTVRRCSATALEAAADIHPNTTQPALSEMATRIRGDGSKENLIAARNLIDSAERDAIETCASYRDCVVFEKARETIHVAIEAANYSALADAAYAAYSQAWLSEGEQVDISSSDSTYAEAARHAVQAAVNVVCKMSDTPRYAAETAAMAHDPVTRDQALTAFAEGIVQILQEMKAPACRWVDNLAPLSP